MAATTPLVNVTMGLLSTGSTLVHNLSSNSSSSSSYYSFSPSSDDRLTSGVFYQVITSSVLGSMILATIIGNVFVIAAIVLEKNLHSVANYLIASLAVADLMVAVLVMPLAAVNEVTQQWILGKEVCDIWIFVDVLSCTSSILHLVAVAMDRFWAVTRIDYIKNQRSANRILLMIAISWTLSICISLPPLIGWNDYDQDNPNSTTIATVITKKECIISQNWGYTVFSTVGAFYLPSIFMLFIYMRIYKAAKTRIRKKRFKPAKVVKYQTAIAAEDSIELSYTQSPVTAGGVAAVTQTAAAGGGGATATTGAESSPAENNGTNLTLRNGSAGAKSDTITTPIAKNRSKAKRSKAERTKEKLADKRERKAARTLAIITGSFITCWLPFFAIAIIRPFCGERCEYPELLISVVLWLGYFNSLLNPIIYTIFSPDFRMAFRKILFGKYHRTRFDPSLRKL